MPHVPDHRPPSIQTRSTTRRRITRAAACSLAPLRKNGMGYGVAQRTHLFGVVPAHGQSTWPLSRSQRLLRAPRAVMDDSTEGLTGHRSVFSGCTPADEPRQLSPRRDSGEAPSREPFMRQAWAKAQGTARDAFPLQPKTPLRLWPRAVWSQPKGWHERPNGQGNAHGPLPLNAASHVETPAHLVEVVYGSNLREIPHARVGVGMRPR